MQDSLNLHIALDDLLKKERIQKLKKKQDIQDTFIKTK